MEITDIKFRNFPEEKQFKALVSITFDNSLAVHDIKIIAGVDRLFLAMPSRRLANGEYKDIVHPIGKEMREIIENSVLTQYNEIKDT